MGYERYPRGTQPGDYFNRGDDYDYGRDYGSGQDFSYSSARDYEAAGELGGGRGNRGRDAGGNRGGGREAYGNRDYYGGRDAYGAPGNRGTYATGRSGGNYGDAGQDRGYHGSYAHDGRRFEDVGQYRHDDDDNYAPVGRTASRRGAPAGGYGRQPQGYDYDDRGFFARAGDEVRSWFGDEDAERRREYDQRLDERNLRHGDNDYQSWRSTQIASLDRDYDEYRRENRTRFASEFATWRTDRQGQRDSLSLVEEHMDVVGSDGAHVGTVDKVRGDRILLTKNDADAGGRHHSIPSRWIQTVDGKVTLRKTAEEAKAHWRDEERNQAFSFYGDKQDDDVQPDSRGRTLNKSFSGTY